MLTNRHPYTTRRHKQLVVTDMSEKTLPHAAVQEQMLREMYLYDTAVQGFE